MTRRQNQLWNNEVKMECYSRDIMFMDPRHNVSLYTINYFDAFNIFKNIICFQFSAGEDDRLQNLMKNMIRNNLK